MFAVASKGPAFQVSVTVQQMNRDKIKVDHCYSMTPVNGRRTITRVTNLFKITAMAANKEHEIETLELNPTVARHAAYPTGWSRRQQELLLDDFVSAALKEITGT